jgi:hypothetical protein
MYRYWAIDSGNRIVHEMELTISRWFLVITVPMEIMCGAAHALLMAFLLWQLTPDLLDYGSFSKRSKKGVLWCLRAAVVFIGIFDAADTILSVVIYIIKTFAPFFQSPSKRDASTGYTNSISPLQRGYSGLDAIVDAVFNCTYLACALAFAVVVILALRAAHRANNLDETLKIYLSLLAAAIFLRSLLDTIWSVVFKLAATFKTIDETLNMQLIQTALYGFLSVVAYVSILRVAALPNTDDVEIRYEIVDRVKRWKSSPDPKRSIYDYTIDTSITAEDVIDRHRKYPADFDELNHSPNRYNGYVYYQFDEQRSIRRTELPLGKCQTTQALSEESILPSTSWRPRSGIWTASADNTRCYRPGVKGWGEIPVARQSMHCAGR